jgi:two-component system chemotaxis response regulator CheY
MRILLVDDSKTMRNIQKAVLTQLGHTDLQEACDGQDALSKAVAFKPELMLVDWNMPVMDGLTFVKTYRAQVSKATPIIMVTTEAEKSRVIEAIKAGVNNYVVKPFTPDMLSQRISETMAKFAASQPAPTPA